MSYNPNDNNPIDNDFHMVLSSSIKEGRKKKDYSLEYVAKKLSNPISKQALYKYEQNKNHLKRDTFIELCSILDLDPHFIFLQASQYLDYLTTHNTIYERKVDDGSYNLYLWSLLNIIELCPDIKNKELVKNKIIEIYNNEKNK